MLFLKPLRLLWCSHLALPYLAKIVSHIHTKEKKDNVTYTSQWIGHAYALCYSCNISEIYFFFPKKKVKEAASVSQLFEGLASMHKALALISFVNLKQDVLSTGEKSQGHQQFKATLSCTRHCLKKDTGEKRKSTRLWNNKKARRCSLGWCGCLWALKKVNHCREMARIGYLQSGGTEFHRLLRLR